MARSGTSILHTSVPAGGLLGNDFLTSLCHGVRMNYHRHSSVRGFTLVEIAIVLIVIGLIVGGVLVGQELIRSAEVVRFISQIGGYNAAVNTFRGKYDCLPGDCGRATRFWPTVSGNCYNGGNTVYSASTCDGDGDGMVAMTVPADGNNELYRVWQHLSNAGLVDRNYAGNSSGSCCYHFTGLNVPAARFGASRPAVGLGWLTAGGQPYYATNMGAGLTGHFYVVAMPSPGGGLGPWGFSPNEARQVDAKADDGNPNAGRVTAVGTICASGTGYMNSDVNSGGGNWWWLGSGCNLAIKADF